MFSASPTFIALQREAAIGAEMIASGVTLLGKSGPFNPGLYSHAFFSLTIGFERTSKLIVLLDYYFENNHKFFNDKILRNKYGHDLNKLFAAIKDVSGKRVADKNHKFPDTELHEKLISFLSDFAKTTRYYNLDFLTNSGSVKYDPIKVWNADIGDLILKKYPLRTKDKVPKRIIEKIQSHVLVRGNTEDHSPVNSLMEVTQKSHVSEHINKYGRLLILQIARAMSEIIAELSMKAFKEQASDIPYLDDYFRIFLNEDNYFLKRKTWGLT